MSPYERYALRWAIVTYSTALTTIAAIAFAACWLECKLFEYCLWSFFKCDVPWYLDLAGGLLLNGLMVALAIFCAIARACGVDVPIIHLH